MYVPSSPFDMLPPQILIDKLKTRENLDSDYAKNDGTEYIISFKKNQSRLTYRSLKIPIGGNDFFHLLTTTVLTYVKEPVTPNVMNGMLVLA